MTTRILPPSEWPAKLAGTLLDPAWQGFSEHDRVVVVEDAEGQVIGCTALMLVWHLEGTWIAPEHRGKASVGRRMYRAARDLFKALHVREVYMMARNAVTAAQCQRLGQAIHLDCDHFIVKVR